MNYFELYPGDYLRDTSDLSLAEHGAYILLMLTYYSSEAPLSSQNAQLFRITHAMSKADKAAVCNVADRFFPVGLDGLRHNARIDREIEKARTRMAAAPERKAHEAERQRRHRERRAALFDGLRSYGVTPDFNAKTADLEALLNGHVTRDITHNVTRHTTATRPHTPYKEQERAESAPAGPVLDPSLPEFKARLFARWKAVEGAGGGAFLNKLFRDHKPESRVLEAVERTLSHAPADHVAFVQGILRKADREESAVDALMAGAL